jgi:hypothetical protein
MTINYNYSNLPYKYSDSAEVCSQLKYLDLRISNASTINSKEVQKLDELKIELRWIAEVKEQIDFLNADMIRYNILFKVSPRNWTLNHAFYNDFCSNNSGGHFSSVI